MGVQIRVDTSAAGFTAVPCYFAQLGGSTWLPAPSGRSRRSGVLVPAFGHIAEPANDGFTFRLLVPELIAVEQVRKAGSLPSAALLLFAGLSLTWTGIQQDDHPTRTSEQDR